MIQITGAILVGSKDLSGDAHFDAIDPSNGAKLGPVFSEAGKAHVDDACALAAAAYPSFAALAPEKRAAFIEDVADRIIGIGGALIDRAMAETGLPRARLEGERGRTVSQLRLFASVVRNGDWVDATVDPALPNREPLPRADLRRRNLAVGPIAMFGASNFPLAFSVAGGDTASALAAGCPVVVKGHPAHPGTGELVARAVRDAVSAAGLHEGVFSYLPGTTHELGGALAADPRIKAIAFTGSRGGGLALATIAAARPEPIPVYAEMSSINPVLLFPHAARSRGATLAEAYIQSLTMGAGQFCTNPGLVLALKSPETDAFIEAAGKAISGAPAQQMLTPAIHGNYEKGVATLGSRPSVTLVARGQNGSGQNQGCGALFVVNAADFKADPVLGHEVFGASSVIILADDFEEMASVITSLEGQLTATLLLDAEDEKDAAALVPLLEQKAGRILVNGWPTGVEVCHAMVHGGPFPATSDSRTTSVGSLAIARFLRPVCYQNFPDGLLPDALKAGNPWGLSRRIDGIWTPSA